MDPDPTKALWDALRSIKEGQVSATARRGKIALRVLNRLREGKKLDIRISTLVKLSIGTGKSTDELLGLTRPDPNAITGEIHVSAAAAAKVRKKLARVAAEMTALVHALPEGGEPKKPKA